MNFIDGRDRSETCLYLFFIKLFNFMTIET